MAPRATPFVLYVVRHAPALDIGEGEAERDEDRELSARGRRRADMVARALAGMEWAPERIYSSPFPRAVQTARALARHAAGSPPIVATPLLAPGADPLKVMGLLKRDGGKCAVIVGHMPHVGQVVSVAVSGAPGLAIELKKAGVCSLRFDSGITPGGATLEWLAQPRHLRAAADGA